VDNNYNLNSPLVFRIYHFLYSWWTASYLACNCGHFDRSTFVAGT